MDPEEWKARKHQLFTEHLPYELAMLDAATDFLSADVKDDPSRLGWFRRQSAIEAFWVHARLLIEFFKQPANSDGSGHHASAQDFAPKFCTQINVGDLLETKINPQVTHINYFRETDPLKKLSSEMIWVKEQIDKEVGNFVKALDDKEWKQVWKESKWWQNREPVKFLSFFAQQNSTTSVFGAWRLMLTALTPPNGDFEYSVAQGDAPEH
jgi:hypothetical protein